MKNLGREATRDLLLLSLIAGSADAASFMGIGQVFTSNMTGNLVLFGIACGQGHWHDAGRTLYVLALFIVGAGLGSHGTRNFPDSAWRKLVMRLVMIEAVLLLTFAVYWAFVSEAGRAAQFFWLVPPLALAMGLQSAAMNRLTIAGVTSTAMTGTLTSFAVGLHGLWLQPSSAGLEIRSRLQKQLLVILLYCAGAATEGACILHASWAIGFLPAGLACLVVIAHLKD